jgi:hypothetical protein
VRSQLGVGAGASPNTVVAKLVARMGEQQARIDEQATLAAKQQEDIVRLKNEQLYVTRDEHDVGDRIVKHTDDGKLALFLPDVPENNFIVATIDSALLEPSAEHHSGEDNEVNVPMWRIVGLLMPPSLRALLTLAHSNLKDTSGREQREDIIVVEYGVEEWPYVVTMIVGKCALDTKSLKTALGQAMRRATAMLDMQPWRAFAVVIITCLSQVCFFRLSQRSRVPSYSLPMDCFVASGDAGGEVSTTPGARLLAYYLANPARLGYVPCTYKPLLLEADLANFAFSHVYVLCARPQRSAVFLLSDTDVASLDTSGRRYVLKVFRDRQRAEREFDVLYRLREIRGVPSLLCNSVLAVHVAHGDAAATEWFGFMLTPYCQSLSASVASPVLFGQFARVLQQASAAGVHNNDVSSCNLLLNKTTVRATNAVIETAFVADWDIASVDDQVLHGFSGKRLFACDEVLMCPQHAARYGSLHNDLESLFYVAVSCAQGEAEWSVTMARAGVNLMSGVHERQRITGLGVCRARRRVRFRRWEAYLIGVRDAIERARADDGCVADIVDAFCHQ